MNWPHAGEIEFQQVFLAYDKHTVLKNLTFKIKAKAKVGIVGRTGFKFFVL
jgi:ABC-type multidrug transport system fused ATPase/permease subunit